MQRKLVLLRLSIMKKIYLTFGLLVILFACESINIPDYECSENGAYFDVEGIETSHVRRDDFSVQYPRLDTVDFNLHRVMVNYQVSYYSENSWSFPKLSFIPKAYALSVSCIQGWKGSKEGLENIEVRTQFAINDNIAAGDKVNELMNIVVYPGIGDFGEIYDLEEYLDQNSIKIESLFFLLFLKEKPTVSDTVAFDIEVELGNGEKYNVSTEPIIYQ